MDRIEVVPESIKQAISTAEAELKWLKDSSNPQDKADLWRVAGYEDCLNVFRRAVLPIERPKQQCTIYQSFGSEEAGLPDISVNPAEHPKQLEAVIVVPIDEAGWVSPTAALGVTQSSTNRSAALTSSMRSGDRMELCTGRTKQMTQTDKDFAAFRDGSCVAIGSVMEGKGAEAWNREFYRDNAGCEIRIMSRAESSNRGGPECEDEVSGGKYSIGQQPCQNLDRRREANAHGEWLNVHECYRCNLTVSYCETCNRDHHENGYENCKPQHSEAK